MRTGIVLLATLIALGVWSSSPADTQNVDETVKVTADIPQSIPDSARKTPNPVSPEPGSLARGKRLFVSQCAMCHGDTGKGDGSLAGRLEMTVTDFAKSRRTRTDGELFYIIRNGHGSMPAEDRLEDEWLWDMVNYIRALTATR